MDIEQIEQRVEWLDEERRKDKATITALQERIAKLEGQLNKANEEVKVLSSDLVEAKTYVARIEKFDDALAAHRAEVKKEIDAQNEKAKKRETTAKKKYGDEIDENRTEIQKLEKRVTDNEKMKADILARKEAETRIERTLNEEKENMKTTREEMQDSVRMVQMIQTEQRQESRRLNDVQGEVTAVRKRVDEHKAKIQLLEDDNKKVEVRISDILGQMQSRAEAQNTFMERVTNAQAEQERAFKTWQKTFSGLDEQTAEISKILKNVSESDRAVEQAQLEFERITEQLKRRINEITEMQRLGEERFRQEWATFKADDQKRWTNYTLTQEELQRESNRQLERLSDQTTLLEENLQEAQDILQHLTEQNEKMLQTQLGNLREWLSEIEKFNKSVR